MTSISYLSEQQFYDAALSESFTHHETMVFISDKISTYSNLTLESSLCKLCSITQDHDLELLRSVANNLNPKSDRTSHVEFQFFVERPQILKRIVLVVLPKEFSRHNCPSRAHYVSPAIKSFFDRKRMAVILYPSESNYIISQAYAASRSFPQYTLRSLKSSPNSTSIVDIIIKFPEDFVGIRDTVIHQVSSVAENIRLAQVLVDMPPNVLHSDAYVEEIIAVKSKLGNSCGLKFFRGETCRDMGLHGIWCVGMASGHAPVLAILSYYPAGTNPDSNPPSICLVGKGIIYDTGGLSIKTGTGMCGMKRDMAGSAAVLGAFASIVQTGASGSTPVHALLCIAENSVGPLSMRPDDVYTLYSGKSVEINNTDAEGRLVLSDGCAYAAKHLNPDYIIDIATLTGAQMVATGKKHAAIYCSDDSLEELAVRVGKYTGDLTFPIVYCPELFRSEFNSAVADMKNSACDRQNALSSCAGQFIGNHIEVPPGQRDFLRSNGRGDRGKWLHVDMAGTGHAGERATGYGVALLHGIVCEICS